MLEQLSPTVPVNPPIGATVSMKVPESTELSVCDEGEAEIEKSVPVPESETDWGLPPALSEIERVPVLVPAADGLNVM
jgi:hypothetical protein